MYELTIPIKSANGSPDLQLKMSFTNILLLTMACGLGYLALGYIIMLIRGKKK
jgi:hypothetical protein